MANRKLNSIKFPDIADTYILDADKVNFDDSETYASGSVGKALQNKANIDGSYSNMTVGNAEQLVSNVKVNDKTPYLFRTSGGSVDIGDREYINGIVGGTVAWNQLVPESWRTSSASSVPFVAGTAITKGHKYLMWGNRTDNSKQTFAYIYVRGADSNIPLTLLNLPASGVLSNGVVFNASENGLSDGTANWNEGNTWIYQGVGSSYIKFENLELFDLTQMFGSTIADYIYSLETATAGAGVAWFKKLFNKPYYAYNAGELMSVKALRHITRGFNAFDGEVDLGGCWTETGTYQVMSGGYMGSPNKIKCLPNTTYCFTASNITAQGFLYYAAFDANGNYISRPYATAIPADKKYGTFTTPSDCYFIGWYLWRSTAFTNAEAEGICINLSWDGERDGEYEEYSEHVYELDPDLELRGIPKLSAGNDLYYDGDVYEPDGTVTRKYGIVDLGTLTWSYETVSATPRFYAGNLPEKSANKGYWLVNSLISNSYARSYNVGQSAGQDKMYGIVSNSKSVFVVDSAYTDATAFTTAMSGVYLVYELATPTTETADPYTSPQIVDDFGTEEYVISDNTFAVPVGHDTDYPINLVAKLEMAPNSPEGNGDYIVRQTNGMNEYVPLVIEDALPTIPSTAGSYKLTVTVAEGSDPVLSWEAE